MYCCLPFLYKPKVVTQLPAEENPQKKEPVDEDPAPAIEDVPQVLKIRHLRIPDALMNIRNPTIKAQFKEFCKANNLCVACSYTNPENPTVLIFNGVLYECPRCDSDAESP